MVGAGSALAGMASAFLHGNGEVLPGILCVVFAMLAQLCANLYRRYYMLNKLMGQPLGWKLPSKPANDQAMLLRTGSIVALLLTLMVGFTIAGMGGWWAAIVGAFIIIGGWLCAGGKHPIMRTPWSWLAGFIFFGPVCVMSTSYLEISHDATTPNDLWDILPAIYASCIMGLMAVNANLVYNYIDAEKDTELGRKSMISKLGKKTSMAFFFTNGLLFSLILLWSCFVLDLGHEWIGVTACVLCFLINLYAWIRLVTQPVERLHNLPDITNFNVLLMGILLLLVALTTGSADESAQIFF